MNNEKLRQTCYRAELHTCAPFLVLLLYWRERKRNCQWVTHFGGALGYRPAEPPSANPCLPSPAIKKMYMVSSDIRGFIQTDFLWESVVETQVRGFLPSTLLGFAINSNSMFGSSLKLKKFIFLAVTTFLWGVSANVHLTKGAHMCFITSISAQHQYFWLCLSRVCVPLQRWPCGHLHKWHQ